jgi:phosphoglucosamine mutase
VLPTPGAPLLIGRYGLDLGVVISASHNPYRDNGIKFFGGDGFKLRDQTELAIETRLEGPTPAASRIGRVRALHGTQEDYLRGLHTRFADLDLAGVRVLLDCANGATYRVGPEIFRRLGADVTVIAEQPDGRNINDGVGSTHVEALAEHLDGHDIAFAFDGDGDRVLAMDRTGAVVDGDELLALATLHQKVPGVAVTVMTNYGFHAAMREAGVEVAITSVGDRYVLEELRQRGWALGGEQSGHIIDMGFVPSGDGVAAALLTLEALGGGDLAERAAMEKLPQKLVNVRVSDRDAAMDSGELASAIEREQAELEGRGRILVRPSGTEQLVRVMAEAPTADEADAVCARLVAIVEATAAPA